MNVEKYKKQFLHSIIKPHNNSTLVELNPFMKKIIHNTFVIMSTSYFDEKWYNTSIQYTMELPIEDKFTLKTYTRSGAVVVNKFMVHNQIQRSYAYAAQLFQYFDEMNPEYFTDTFDLSEEGMRVANKLDDECNNDILHNIILNYITDIQRIINNGPRNPNTLILYRGVKKDYLDTSSNLIMNGLCSASYSVDIANTFKEKCLYELVLLKDTPCIAVSGITKFPKEKEILINLDKLHANVKQQMYKYSIDTCRLGIESDRQTFTDWNYLYNKVVNPSFRDEYNMNNSNGNSNENIGFKGTLFKEKVRRVILNTNSNDTDSIINSNTNINNNNDTNNENIFENNTPTIHIKKIGGSRCTMRVRRPGKKSQYEIDNPDFMYKFTHPLIWKRTNKPISEEARLAIKELEDSDSD